MHYFTEKFWWQDRNDIFVELCIVLNALLSLNKMASKMINYEYNWGVKYNL